MPLPAAACHSPPVVYVLNAAAATVCRQRKVAFVEFEDVRSAEDAFKAMRNTMLHGVA
jgi:RNA recognition motif-containing protein